MMDEDKTWLAQQQPARVATSDACFMIVAAFQAGPSALPLVPTGLEHFDDAPPQTIMLERKRLLKRS